MGLIRKYLCRIGLHSWVRTGLVCRHELRCRIRNEVRGEYCGTAIGFDWIEDNQCARCGLEDNRIAIETAAIRKEEQEKWDGIRQDRMDAEEFRATMDAVEFVSKALSDSSIPPCVVGSGWVYGQPTEPGDYEWASFRYSLNPNEVTVYPGYNGDTRCWGRNVWFRKISGAGDGQ